MINLLSMIAAYLLGSFPSAYVAGRLFAGLDITKHGSGNVGGTNALRVLGPGPAIAVAIVDVGKALVPTLWAQHAFGGNVWPTLLVAMAAILGHNFSIFLRFKGGKGIASTIGASIALFPQAIAIMMGIALVVIAITRYVSLGSICLVALLPLLLWWRGATVPEIEFAVLLAVLGVWRHRGNIERLFNGTERRFGSK